MDVRTTLASVPHFTLAIVGWSGLYDCPPYHRGSVPLTPQDIAENAERRGGQYEAGRRNRLWFGARVTAEQGIGDWSTAIGEVRRCAATP
jgi:hypothetical protein